MSGPTSWRVVLCDSMTGPAGEVQAAGAGTVHAGMSAARLVRVILGDGRGLGVEWEYTLYGHGWRRYAYLHTAGQLLDLRRLPPPKAASPPPARKRTRR